MATNAIPAVHCHIFLEKFQKYMNIKKQSGSGYLNDNTYVHGNFKHAQALDKEVSSHAISTKIQAFNFWLANVPGVKVADIAQINTLIEKNRAIRFWLPILRLTPTQENANYYSDGIKEIFTDTNAQIEEFNKNIDLIKGIVKTYKPGPNAFMRMSEPVLTLNDILPSKIKLGKPIQEVIAYALENPTIVMDSIKTTQDAKASTSGLFFIYHKNKQQDGFVGSDRLYAPLNEAEIFYDGAKAQRSARARGIQDYQVWEASLDFNRAIHQSSNFIPGPTITTIVSNQEKELITKAIATREYQNMQEKLAQYEEILKTNNLLPAQADNSIDTAKKRNKI